MDRMARLCNSSWGAWTGSSESLEGERQSTQPIYTILRVVYCLETRNCSLRIVLLVRFWCDRLILQESIYRVMVLSQNLQVKAASLPSKFPHVNNAADAVARMHVKESLVDLTEPSAVSDKFVNLQLSCHVVTD